MTWNFIKAFNGIVMSSNQVIVFKFYGHNLKATIKLISIVELADEQWQSPSERGYFNGKYGRDFHESTRQSN
jgi:hypothetical protein